MKCVARRVNWTQRDFLLGWNLPCKWSARTHRCVIHVRVAFYDAEKRLGRVGDLVEGFDAVMYAMFQRKKQRNVQADVI